MRAAGATTAVMAGLDPWAFSPRTRSVGIYAATQKDIDHRVKPGDDDYRLVPA
jgi:hypothetical protein